eukprot:252875_1
MTSRKQIRINECDKNELLELPGIGEKTADSIVTARSAKLFDSFNDLIHRVKGIGSKKKNKILEKFEVIFEYENDNQDPICINDNALIAANVSSQMVKPSHMSIQNKNNNKKRRLEWENISQRATKSLASEQEDCLKNNGYCNLGAKCM